MSNRGVCGEKKSNRLGNVVCERSLTGLIYYLSLGHVSFTEHWLSERSPNHNSALPSCAFRLVRNTENRWSGSSGTPEKLAYVIQFALLI